MNVEYGVEVAFLVIVMFSSGHRGHICANVSSYGSSGQMYRCGPLLPSADSHKQQTLRETPSKGARCQLKITSRDGSMGDSWVPDWLGCAICSGPVPAPVAPNVTKLRRVEYGCFPCGGLMWFWLD